MEFVLRLQNLETSAHSSGSTYTPISNKTKKLSSTQALHSCIDILRINNTARTRLSCHHVDGLWHLFAPSPQLLTLVNTVSIESHSIRPLRGQNKALKYPRTRIL